MPPCSPPLRRRWRDEGRTCRARGDSMSFNTIARCAYDETFGQRVRAAYAKGGLTGNPDPAWYSMRWQIAADPSVEGPYASAIAANNENPGGDEAVVTD